MKMTRREYNEFINNIDIIDDNFFVEWDYEICNKFSKTDKQMYRYTCPNCKNSIVTTDKYDTFILPFRGHKYCGYCGYECIKEN